MNRNNRALLILLGILLLIVLIGPVVGMGMMGPRMMGPGMMWRFGAPDGPAAAGGWPWGLAMGLGMLAMLAFWGALVVGIVLLVRWLTSGTGGPAGQAGESALDVLKRRYAAGEITREEYAQMRRELEG